MTTCPPRLFPFLDPPDTQTQAIIAAAFDIPNRPTPRYAPSCIVTSDDFIIADFTGRDGERHMGAFVGAFPDLRANITKFIEHFALTDTEAQAVRDAVNNWISTDYSGKARL